MDCAADGMMTQAAVALLVPRHPLDILGPQNVFSLRKINPTAAALLDYADPIARFLRSRVHPRIAGWQGKPLE
jgi:hypothetical protein